MDLKVVISCSVVFGLVLVRSLIVVACVAAPLCLYSGDHYCTSQNILMTLSGEKIKLSYWRMLVNRKKFHQCDVVYLYMLHKDPHTRSPLTWGVFKQRMYIWHSWITTAVTQADFYVWCRYESLLMYYNHHTQAPATTLTPPGAFNVSDQCAGLNEWMFTRGTHIIFYL